MAMTPEQNKLYLQIGEVFKPSPIFDQEMFAGRLKERGAILDTILQPGQHAIIFGERGVGKTSLANMLSPYLESLGRRVLAPKASCATGDNYTAIWRKLFSQIVVSQKKHLLQETTVYKKLSEELPDIITPQFVQEQLAELGPQTTLIVIVDEFDRFEEKEVFADTIKAMSDYDVPVTIIVVGVAETVTDLITAHESIGRCILQVHLERMKITDLQEILDRGHAKLGMTMDEEAKVFICHLSQGLPYFVHELARHSGRVSVERNSRNVTAPDVHDGITAFVIGAQQELLRQRYHQAIASSQKDALYEPILIACALTKTNDLGYFPAGDIRPAIKIVAGKPFQIPAFSKHLHAFCEDSRGEVLKKTGKHHSYQFKFSDPLMKPYIVMRALAERRVTKEIAQTLLRQK